MARTKEWICKKPGVGNSTIYWFPGCDREAQGGWREEGGKVGRDFVFWNRLFRFSPEATSIAILMCLMESACQK